GTDQRASISAAPPGAHRTGSDRSELHHQSPVAVESGARSLSHVERQERQLHEGRARPDAMSTANRARSRRGTRRRPGRTRSGNSYVGGTAYAVSKRSTISLLGQSSSASPVIRTRR